MNWLQKIAKRGIKYDSSSVQFDFPKSIASKIKQWGQKHIKDSDLFTEKDNSKGREDETHTTILFGLFTTDIRKIENAVQNINPFSIQLGLISRFVPKGKEYDVVKIEIEGNGLYELNKVISELKNNDEHPIYKPHCTLAYVKKGHCVELSGNGDLKGLSCKVNEITFSSKTGEKSKIKLNK
jgi:2'-5' RNA ligase